MPFSNLSLHLLFQLYKKPIFLTLHLADLSLTPYLKLIIFAFITFSALYVAKAGRPSCDTVHDRVRVHIYLKTATAKIKTFANLPLNTAS